MKRSARNVLRGTVVDIVTGAVTNAAVKDLGLAVGKPAAAVIKASDVMVGVDD